MSYLINRSLSQSECNKLGIALEKILYDIVMKYTKFKDKCIKNNLYGTNEYFELLDIKINFRLKEYKKILNKIADIIFE